MPPFSPQIVQALTWTICNQDRATETRNKFINLDFYVPPDERFSHIKLSEFISNSIQAVVHFVIPELKSLFQGDLLNFESLDQIKKDFYYNERNQVFESMVMEKLKVLLPHDLFKKVSKMIKEKPIKFPVPQVIAGKQILQTLAQKRWISCLL